MLPGVGGGGGGQGTPGVRGGGGGGGGGPGAPPETLRIWVGVEAQSSDDDRFGAGLAFLKALFSTSVGLIFTNSTRFATLGVSSGLNSASRLLKNIEFVTIESPPVNLVTDAFCSEF